LLRDTDHVVVCDAVDQFVVGIDTCASGLPVDDNREGLVFLSELFLLHVQWFLFIFLAGETPISMKSARGIVATVRISELFPAPLGPSSPNILLPMVSDTFLNARTPFG
jgi:hypothetical protein